MGYDLGAFLWRWRSSMFVCVDQLWYCRCVHIGLTTACFWSQQVTTIFAVVFLVYFVTVRTNVSGVSTSINVWIMVSIFVFLFGSSAKQASTASYCSTRRFWFVQCLVSRIVVHVQSHRVCPGNRTKQNDRWSSASCAKDHHQWSIRWPIRK